MREFAGMQEALPGEVYQRVSMQTLKDNRACTGGARAFKRALRNGKSMVVSPSNVWKWQHVLPMDWLTSVMGGDEESEYFSRQESVTSQVYRMNDELMGIVKKMHARSPKVMTKKRKKQILDALQLLCDVQLDMVDADVLCEVMFGEDVVVVNGGWE